MEKPEVLISRCRFPEVGAGTFLTVLNSLALNTRPTATHPSRLVILSEWGGGLGSS